MEKDLKVFSIEKFQKLTNIYGKVYDVNLEKDIALIAVLTDKSIEEVEDLDIDEYKAELVNMSEITFDIEDTTLINEVTIGDNKYASITTGEYKPKVKEIFLINKYINQYPTEFIKYIAAIIFKKVDGDSNIIKDYSEEGIEERAELFNKELNMVILTPYLNMLSIKLLAKNEVSE